jgi:hypothetical protein
MSLWDKIMGYINEYAYGNVGNNTARKKLLTGKVEIHMEGQWVPVTKVAAKTFIDAAPPEEPGEPPPLSETPRVNKKRKKVNAAAFDNGGDVPPADEEAPKIDFNAVRRRQAADVERAMQEQLKGKKLQPPPPAKKGKGKKTKVQREPEPDEDDGLPIAPTYAGDPAFFLSQMEELLQRLDQVQFSSASGYRDLQQIRGDMRDCLSAFRGDDQPDGIPEE